MEVHLPCPPLRDWFARRWHDAKLGAWDPAQAPRRLRPLLRSWPQVDDAGELDVLVFGTALERARVPEDGLAQLRPGAQLVELALPRARPMRALLGLERRPLVLAAAGQDRVREWIARGYCELEQWESVDPAGVIVTVARVR